MPNHSIIRILLNVKKKELLSYKIWKDGRMILNFDRGLFRDLESHIFWLQVFRLSFVWLQATPRYTLCIKVAFERQGGSAINVMFHWLHPTILQVLLFSNIWSKKLRSLLFLEYNILTRMMYEISELWTFYEIDLKQA